MKLVREHISFERNLPIKRSLKVGMFSKIEDWLETYYKNVSNATRSSKYTINEDFTIDIDGFFAMDWNDNFPDFIQFNKVKGSFYVGHKNGMTSLRGCPSTIIDGDFDCSWDMLKNLIGGPKVVVGNYYCGLIPTLESLEGLATEISGSFACNNKAGLSKKDIPAGVNIKGSISIGEW